MTARHVLGAFLVALPFLAIIAVYVWAEGWRKGLALCAVGFGATALVVAAAAAGVYLLDPAPTFRLACEPPGNAAPANHRTATPPTPSLPENERITR